jgi:hypothetical protein
MCGKPRPSSSSAPRWYRWDTRSDRCRCLRESGWRCQELAILTCASSAAVVALVVLELFPFAFDQVAVQARTRRLLPVIELVTGRTVLAGRRIAFRRRCVDQVDCHVRHHVRLPDGVEAVWLDGGVWVAGATDAGLNSRESDALPAPPLPPRFGPLGRRGLFLGADCDCAAAWPEASACMVASVVETVVPVEAVMFLVSSCKSSKC